MLDLDEDAGDSGFRPLVLGLLRVFGKLCWGLPLKGMWELYTGLCRDTSGIMSGLEFP